MTSKYKRDLQRLAHEFMEAERADGRSFTKHELARWALATGKVKREKGYADRLVAQRLAEEFATAMREEFTRDRRGRPVRVLHAGRVGGRMRWNSRTAAPRGFLGLVMAQRRDQIVGDCRSLKIEVDSLNEERFADDPIQMKFDFRNDLAELEAAEAAGVAARRR